MSDISRRQTLTGALALATAGTMLQSVRPAHAATTHDVSIESFAFEPAELTVSVGDSVRFTNNDGTPHDAAADDGAFETPILNPGNSNTVTLGVTGVHEYHCSIHPAMRAVIIVE